MKVIATPARDTVLAGFAYDLAQLIRHSSDAIFATAQGSILSNLRSTLAQTSLDNGASHILFIDSDMRFPPDTLERLLIHDKPIIGANCRQRNSPKFTARKNDDFISSSGKTGIEQVDSIGFGVTLIVAEVFHRMRKPWFSMPWDGTKHCGEDIYFCKRAQEMGLSVYIDHDLSQQVKHSGLVEFGI